MFEDITDEVALHLEKFQLLFTLDIGGKRLNIDHYHFTVEAWQKTILYD